MKVYSMPVISVGNVFNNVPFESLVSDHLMLNKFTRPSIASLHKDEMPGKASGCRNGNGILEVHPSLSHCSRTTPTIEITD